MEQQLKDWQSAFFRKLDSAPGMELLFDRMPDVVYSVKDREGRYLWFSMAGVERCGFHHRDEVIGKKAADLFPAHMVARYEEQDRLLFASGEPVLDRLDLTLYADRSPGWCLTHKLPLRDKEGAIIALACLSRDLIEPDRAGLIDSRFARIVDTMNQDFAEALRVEVLAESAGFSAAQFERRMKRVFQIGPAQFIIKRRIEAAIQKLEHSEDSLSAVAAACGFTDQSAMTRQFRSTTGLTPGQYRKEMAARRGAALKTVRDNFSD